MTTESTALTTTNNDQVAMMLADSKRFLSRIQLMTSSSDPCKEGKFPVNHFAILEGQDSFVDVGGNPVHIFAHRPLALEWGEEVNAVYDPKIIDGKPTGEFKRIMDKANSGDKEAKAMYGVQFLLWIPSVQRFVSFMCGSKSQRNEIPNFVGAVGKDVKLIPHKIVTKKYTWFITKIGQCSESLDQPDEALLEDTLQSFLNPPASEKEAVDVAADRG